MQTISTREPPDDGWHQGGRLANVLIEQARSFRAQALDNQRMAPVLYRAADALEKRAKGLGHAKRP